MRQLTPRQSQILEMVQDFIAETGMPPTRAEIARELGFKSANAAEEHLRALQKKGVLELVPGASRGIQLKDSLRDQIGLPLVGRVAAGSPILAEEHIEDYCSLPTSFFSPAADYFLTVHGDSMIDVGIFDGDLLAVHSTPLANNGDIVVARIEDEVTVKRLHKTRQQHIIELLPENQDFSPIEVDLREQEFAIEGLSVGVLRRSL